MGRQHGVQVGCRCAGVLCHTAKHTPGLGVRGVERRCRARRTSRRATTGESHTSAPLGLRGETARWWPFLAKMSPVTQPRWKPPGKGILGDVLQPGQVNLLQSHSSFHRPEHPALGMCSCSQESREARDKWHSYLGIGTEEEPRKQ